jgi:hypothetical protein
MSPGSRRRTIGRLSPRPGHGAAQPTDSHVEATTIDNATPDNATTRRNSVPEEIEEGEEEPQPPVGHIRVVYLGPVAPHWEVQSNYGDPAVINPFRDRTIARLTLLPPHDPQFRRNRERVVRDAEREHLELEWDLGIPDEEESPAPIPD